MDGERVLVVDDEPGVCRMVARCIRARSPGTEVHEAHSAQEAIAQIEQVRPHLVFLDLNIDVSLDGIGLCEAIRAHPATREISIIVLTGELSPETEFALLRAGADDYIRKADFSADRIVCRMEAVLRRNRTPVEETTVHGPLVIDRKRREVIVDGTEVEFTPREFDILQALAANRDRALSRVELICTDDGTPAAAAGRTVDVHIASIRKKLIPYAWLIETVIGTGYRLGAVPVDEQTVP